MKRNYYIFSNTQLRRKNNTLYFNTIEKSSDDDTLCNPDRNFSQSLRNRIVPVEDVNAIFAYGQIYFNTKLMSFLSSHLIPLHVFDLSGNYSGAFYPKDISFADNLFMKQMIASGDDDMKLSIGREIVSAACSNYEYSYLLLNMMSFNVRDYISVNNDLRSEIAAANCSGELSRIKSDLIFFFKDCWHDIFKYHFRASKEIEKKIKAVFDFVGMMINATCISEIYKCGMSPSIGFFEYQGSRNRLSLGKDIGDIFKPVIITRMLSKMLKKQEVQFRSFITSGNFCMLAEEAIRYLVVRFDEELNSTYCTVEKDTSVNLHNLLSNEFKNLAQAVEKGESYIVHRISD